jgi:ATP-dependent 26S proteasome regulatory subunit
LVTVQDVYIYAECPGQVNFIVAARGVLRQNHIVNDSVDFLAPDLTLDPAILNRPSRFDRKYYFDLPAEAERSAYIAAWNKELQPELRLAETGAEEVVQQTEGFSFAYMKELFVSSMMQWMATGGVSMDEIILGQAVQLREQMATSVKSLSRSQSAHS